MTIKMIIDANVLRPVRTQYGKDIRKAYERGDINISRHEFTELMPRYDGILNTLSTVLKDNYIEEVDHLNNVKIRKLTPTECFKLMGFTAEDCAKCSTVGISNSQLYKQAGNSIVVDVLEAIFTSLGERYEEFE